MVRSMACSTKERKSDAVRRLTRSGEYKKALRIAKGFRLGITREQSDKMGIAYECMVHPQFYEQLGFVIDEKIDDGVEVLVGLYGGE